MKLYHFNIIRKGQKALRLVLTCLVVLPGLNAIAQKPQVEEVTIIGIFNPTISDANKILRNPVLQDTTIPLPAMNYSIVSQPLDVSFPVYRIDAMKTDLDQDKELLKNYIKGGFGNFTTPYFEFFANKPQSKKSGFGMHYRHISSKNTPEHYTKADMSSNQAEIFGKLFSRNSTLTGTIGFDRLMVHRYGFITDSIADSLLPSSDQLRQVYTLVNTRLGIESMDSKRSDLNYNIFLDAYFLGDKFDTRETGIGLNGKLETNVDLLGFKNSQTLGMNYKADMWSQKMDTAAGITNSLISLQPYFGTSVEEYELWLGLNASILTDTATEFSVFPKIKGALNIIPNVLRLWAGIDGYYSANSMLTNYRTNPYISSQQQFLFSKTGFEFSGGLSSSLGRFLDMNIRVRGGNTNDAVFFINDTTERYLNTFVIQSDDVDYIEGGIEFSFNRRDAWRVLIGATYTTISTDSIVKPWHTPEMVFYVNGMVKITPKMTLTANLNAFGKMFARNFIWNSNLNRFDEHAPLELNSFLDASVGLRYQFNSHFSAFANFNNLAGKKYQRWNQYPVYGFNMLAGISYSF
ncbi:MAG: TonB-dependent receptor [Bacteroidales bacterium]|nr:TonB-dependent receptor [Bacteroidales bacterium]